MKIVELLDNKDEIYNVHWELDKDKFTIRWRWPGNIDIVYIVKTNTLDNFSLDDIDKSNVKLYTREEYREFNGYWEFVKEISQYTYYIFPAALKEDEILLLKQQNGKNKVLINTGKPEIYYEIRQLQPLRNFFSKEKVLQIIIDSETALNKDVLCYVKKSNSYPINREDGIAFDFIDNISAGKNIMPEIKVNKNEYVKVFIKDVNKYGSAYTLKGR
ncbi:hypothetical protein [Clostridium kluyveri]|uniref:Beta-mannanase n=1 Tax=Clostridium kluyveri TaxID=1534 RepID=A0A1L5F7W6_CLOKL|nr:hypothetical protein [Clostridium kluyveri]APM39105.1 hypothetical protein BS101_10295 [Clostridium kluyveri]UZQ51430.1 hypothetical protein OP486_04425 [Clostridium kluyveri]